MKYKLLTIILSLVILLPAVALADPLLDSFSVTSPVPISGGNNATITVNCTYSETDNISNIADDLSFIYVEELLGKVYFNQTTQITIDNDTEKSYVELEVPYYQTPDDYNSMCSVYDGLNNVTDSKNITVPEVIAFDINDTSITYTVDGQSEVYPNQVAMSENIKIENIGNVPLNSQWNGSDLTSNGNSIPIGNINHTITKSISQEYANETNYTGSPYNPSNAFDNDFGTSSAGYLYSDVDFYENYSIPNSATNIQLETKWGADNNTGVSGDSSPSVDLYLWNYSSDSWLLVDNASSYYDIYDRSFTILNNYTIPDDCIGDKIRFWINLGTRITSDNAGDNRYFESSLHYDYNEEKSITNSTQIIEDLPILSDLQPFFELYVPFGTQAGEYTNTLTHTVSKQ